MLPTEAVKKSKMLYTILWYTVDKLKFMYGHLFGKEKVGKVSHKNATFYS